MPAHTAGRTARKIAGGASTSVATSLVPGLSVRVAFLTSPGSLSPSWTDITADVLTANGASLNTHRGRSSERDSFSPGSVQLVLKNESRQYDPLNTASPFYPNVKPGRLIQILGQPAGGGIPRPLFTGFVDSWPQEYTEGNLFSTVTIQAFDALTSLNDTIQPDPVFVYTLSTIGSCELFLRTCDGRTWFDESGYSRHATKSNDVAHSASTFGSNVHRYRPKSQSSRAFIGGAGYFLTAQPAGVNGSAQIGSSLAVGLTSPSISGGRYTLPTITLGTSYSVSFWFQSGLTNTSFAQARSVQILGGLVGGTSIAAAITSAQSINGVDQGLGTSFAWSAPGGASGFGGTGYDVSDGHPHHVLFTASAAGRATYYDGVLVSSGAATPTTATFDTIDLDQYTAQAPPPYTAILDSPPTSNTAVQDITIWSKVLSATEALNIYQFGIGLVRENTVDRANRLLASVSSPTPFTFYTKDPTRATCLDYTPAFQGTLDALSEVADTEQGRLFVDASGALVMHGRWWTQEGLAAANFSLTGDSSGVVIKQLGTEQSTREVLNDITVSATSGTTAHTTDATSIDAYRRRARSVSTLLPGATEAAALAAGLVEFNKDPVTRLTRPLEVQLGYCTAAQQATLLAVEIGAKVTVTYTPVGSGSAVTLPMAVEGIAWDITYDDWHVSFDLAPLPFDTGTIGLFVLDDPVFGVLDVGNRLAF